MCARANVVSVAAFGRTEDEEKEEEEWRGQKKMRGNGATFREYTKWHINFFDMYIQCLFVCDFLLDADSRHFCSGARSLCAGTFQ